MKITKRKENIEINNVMKGIALAKRRRNRKSINISKNEAAGKKRREIDLMTEIVLIDTIVVAVRINIRRRRSRKIKRGKMSANLDLIREIIVGIMIDC